MKNEEVKMMMHDTDVFDYSGVGFVLVGPGKTGTVWLSQCLREHSQIFVSGENNFLTHYKDLGWDYWGKNFMRRGKKDIVGDYANNYFFFDGIPEQLAVLNPQLKIIVCVRNPVERAVSFYKHDIRWNVLGKHMRLKFLVKEDLFYNRYIHGGCYSVHIQRFIDAFGPERIYLFSSPGEGDALAQRLADLFQFIGVDNQLVPSFDKRLNVTPSPLFPVMHRASFYAGNKRLKWLARKLDPLNCKWGEKKAHLQIKSEDIETIRSIYIANNEAENLRELVRKYHLNGPLYTEQWELT